MSVETAAAASLTNFAFDQRRRSERRICDLQVVVRTSGGDMSGRLVDVSAGGLGLRIATLSPLKPGMKLLVVHHRLGDIPCVLRWSMHPRYGAEFLAGRNALSRVHALYDALPRAPDEI